MTSRPSPTKAKGAGDVNRLDEYSKLLLATCFERASGRFGIVLDLALADCAAHRLKPKQSWPATPGNLSVFTTGAKSWPAPPLPWDRRSVFKFEVVWYLHGCKQPHLPASVASAQTYLAATEEASDDAGRPTREALRWFFRVAWAPPLLPALAFFRNDSGGCSRDRDPEGTVVMARVRALSATETKPFTPDRGQSDPARIIQDWCRRSWRRLAARRRLFAAEADQEIFALHGVANLGENLLHDAGSGGVDGRLHFHGLNRKQLGVLRHLGADADGEA
jgi:hypothetical protein